MGSVADVRIPESLPQACLLPYRARQSTPRRADHTGAPPDLCPWWRRNHQLYIISAGEGGGELARVDACPGRLPWQGTRVVHHSQRMAGHSPDGTRAASNVVSAYTSLLMKGIVLAGGKGSRLRPFTYSGAKQLVPVANTPVLHFPVHQLVAAGVTEIALVVGDTAGQIRAAMGDGLDFGAKFTYVRQAAPLGIAHAVLACREFVGGDPFVLYLGDNVLNGGITEFVNVFASGGAAGSVILKAVGDPRAFGVAELCGERLVRVVEKPADPPSNLAVIGIYAFAPGVFDVIARQVPSARGELEIADTINGLLERGLVVTASVTPEYWIDTGKMEDILDANRVLLAGLSTSVHPSATVSDSVIEGVVAIGAKATLERCRIIGPVVIGAGVTLGDCEVGPDVAIADGASLQSVGIRDSIVMQDAALTACPGIESSMIGRFTTVSGAPAGSRLTLGDHSRFEVRQ